ncbi:cell division protein FtsQ/DivIB [Citricoccus sp. GCM10030269]|uniref:cell division protein FtsQ/DivIB n=1 Tax=Citricoccus sp. GCM10030269 TaxID=3273388 RepID=UPI00361F1469
MTDVDETTRTSTDRDNVLEFPETEGEVRHRRRRLWWVSGAGVVVLLGILGAVLYFSPLLAVQTVTVTGTDLVSQQRALERLQPLVGMPLPQVGERAVEDLLSDEPAVREAIVHAEPPSSLSVEIVEYEPVAAVPDGDRRVLYSADGKALAEVPADRAAEYQLPSVASVEDVRDPQVFDVITSVLGTLPESIRTQMESASAQTVDSVTLKLKDGRTVLWGNADQGPRKAQVLEALLGIPENDQAPVSEFDVSTPDRPVTR